MVTSVFKKSDTNSQYYVKKAYSPADEVRHVHFMHNILLNKWNQLAILLILTAIITPIILIVTIYSLNIPISTTNPIDDTCVINSTYQVQCGSFNITKDDCDSIECCFINNFCYHRAPSRHGYTWSDSTKTYRARRKTTPLKNPSHPELSIAVTEVNTQRLKIQFYNPKQVKVDSNAAKIDDKLYSYRITDSANVIINRTSKNNSAIVFTTSYGPLITSDNYWEMALSLQSDHLFGFGEMYLKSNQTFTFYNNPNELNRLPIVMAYKDFRYHGVYIRTGSLLEVQILESNVMVLRSLTASPIGFEFDVVVGETPADVTHEFRGMQKSSVPPYWTLGVHICRNTQDTPIVSDVIKAVKELKDKSTFPYESDCIHENLFSLVMDTTDEENKNINECVKSDIINANKHFIMPFSSQIRNDSKVYENALEKNIFYLNASTCKVISKDHDDKYMVSYPNYNHQNTSEWFSKYLPNVPAINYASGLILRSSWPLFENYTANLTNSQLVYYHEDFEQTFSSLLPWNATTQCDKDKTQYHMESHNEYGYNIAQQFEQLRTKASLQSDFILSASTYMDTKNDVPTLFGTINQNLNISWLNLQKQLTNSLFYSTFVHPVLHVTPVCGTTEHFNASLHEDLCLRWYYLTATLPMFYIASVKPYRDPFNLPTKYVQERAVDVIRRRYGLLPYFNTVLRSTHNQPLVRPMFYNFPYDNQTFRLSAQYMIGEALLSVQIVTPTQQNEPINIYLPVEHTIVDDDKYGSVWYEFRSGEQFVSPANNTDGVDRVETGSSAVVAPGRKIQMSVRNSDWIMFILGGHIIAVHDFINIKAGNADTLRKTTPLTILVALKCQNILSTIPDANKTINEYQASTTIDNTQPSKSTELPILVDNVTEEDDPGTDTPVCDATGEHLVLDDPATYVTFKSNATHLTIYNLNTIQANVCGEILKEITVKQIHVYGINLMEVQIMDMGIIDICKEKNDFITVLYKFN